MMTSLPGRWLAATAAVWLLASDASPQVVVGQDGKDVVYLPTPPALVEAMLDLARVTARDYVVDLGSGDGRIVIAAAQRGARALGIEYDANLVAMAEANAVRAGVNDRVTFAEADLFEADFSKATVVATFLLADIMLKLRPRILELAPGSRVVSNSFTMEGWTPDRTATLEGCTTWCTAHLWIVPARVEGTWRLPQGELSLKQDFQMVSGALVSPASRTPLAGGRLQGDQIAFSAGGMRYTGRVTGNVMRGTVSGKVGSATWTATKSGGE